MAKTIIEARSALHGFMKFLRFGILFTLLVSVFLFLPVPTVFAQTTGSISGTVRGPGGVPVSGATVSTQTVVFNMLSPMGSGSAVTAADGTYTITNLQAGGYLVSTQSSELAKQYYNNAANMSAATAVMVTSGGTTSNIDFSLVVGGTITGIVRGPGGTPLAGATVMVYNTALSTYSLGTSAADGTYSITGLPAGGYKVNAINSGYVNQYFNHADSSSTMTMVAVTSGGTTSNINFDLVEGGTITGTVRGTGGTPLAGIGINAYGDHFRGVGTSAADGTYSITGVPSGSHWVNVWLLSNTQLSPQFYNHADNISTATPVSVTSGGTTSNIDFNLVEGGGTIQGRITLPGGLPCQGCIIQVLDAVSRTGNEHIVSTTVCSSDGSYASGPLPTGNYKVSAGTLALAFSGISLGYHYWPSGTTNFDNALLVPVTAGQSTPNINIEIVPFIFTDQTGIARSTVATSNSIFVWWISPGTTASVSITGGEYSVNGGAYTSSPGTVSYGNSVQVRQTSSSSYGMTTNATLTIGGASDTFSVTTLSNTPPVIPAPPTGGIQGTQITINGSNFGAVQGGSYVDFNGVQGTIAYWSDTEIGVIVPPGATSGSMRVVTSHGGASSDMSFTVYPPECGAPIKVAGSNYFTIQDAYNNAASGSTVQITEGLFNTGNLEFNRDISTKVDGGYNCEYNIKTGYSTIDGTVTIKDGSVTVEGLIIK